MRRTVAFAALAAGVAVGVAKRLKARAVGKLLYEDGRWFVVTVNCPPERLSDPLPEPLERLRDNVELRMSPAPGGRGTELAARPRNGVVAGALDRIRGDDPRQAVRAALRETKSLIETGEVLRPDTPPTTGATLLEPATRRATGETRR
ncbi:hypothetical protein SAMN04489712_106303 [Thermomonospora echinospora]|uniref:Uncharacterized protein n=1 Tax=Thermomonospora echinospora TaxID=1992 RepID=A0A1H6B874_9ACTN|nr:hypothetical protein [Thermomonospora echinospora]SEG56316.1 hypothetical protein SAMN04489712_106303 [Thermomonospora echinospora]